MSKRVLVINPMGSDLYDRVTLDVVAPAVGHDTDVEVRNLGDSVPASPFLPPAATYHNQLIQAVQDAAADGFDAVAIACTADPALPECKRVSSVPVTGPMEAVSHTAPSLGYLGIITRRLPAGTGQHLPQDANWIRDLIRRYGMSDNVASIRVAPVVDHPTPEEVTWLFKESPEQLLERVMDAMSKAAQGPGIEQAELAYADDDARVLFFGCTLWGGLLDPVRKAVPVPVLDPLVTMVRYAEYLAWNN